MSRWSRALVLLIVFMVVIMGAQSQAQTPTITGVSPASGQIGTQITITGQGLLGSTSYGGVVSSLLIGGQAATTTSWTDTQIVATVPSGIPGNSTSIGISTNYNNYYNYYANSNTYTWTILQPLITAMSPTSGTPTTAVTLTGSGFGATQGTSTVTFSGAPATVTSWSDTQIIVTVPSGTASGSFLVSVPGLSPSSSSFFTLTPYIGSVSPASGQIGTKITITGQGLLGSSSYNSVVSCLLIGGQAATTTSWTDTQIVATIPSGIPGNSTSIGISTNYNNYYNYKDNSNTYNWTVSKLAVTSLSPLTGPVGTAVTIIGNGFGASQSSSTVSFNGIAGIATSWTDTQLIVPVPSGATTGNVMVTVDGVSSNGTSFTVLPSGFVATSGPMAASRYRQTATRLTTGQVLFAGGLSTSGVLNSTELYDFASQTFAAANPMNVARWLHTSTLLNDGTVLIAGGSDLINQETLDSAEIYNPATGTFSLLSNTLNTARVGHTATLLNSGQVLLVGGYDPNTGLIACAELYDPPTQTFIDLGDTNSPRYRHTATILQNGQVLIAGGEMDPTPSAAYNTAELYDSASQTFTPLAVPMVSAREGHAATLLNNGQVLITGGDVPGTGSLNAAELFDPASGTFIAVSATMTVPRVSHTMTLLDGGKVLINGGATNSSVSSTVLDAAELYDPASQTFVPAGNMASDREHQTVSLLNDGTVLVTGTDGINFFNTAEIFTSSQLNGLASIAITPATSSIGLGAQQRFTATGTFNDGSSEPLASVLWNSSAPIVAPISGDATDPGVGSTVAIGTTTITAIAAGVSGSTTLTVTAPQLVSIVLSPQGAIIPAGATQQFAVTGSYTDGSTQDLTSTANWSTPATVVALITNNGLASGSFQGTTTVQASVGTLSVSTTLIVTAPTLVSIAMTPAATTIALGSSQQYQAIGTYRDGSTQDITTLLSWSSGTPTVVTITNTGLAKSVSQGTATLTGGFESASTSVTLTVAPPNLTSISVMPSAASLFIGAAQQLSATGIYTDGSTQNLTASGTWISSNPSAIAVSSTGLVTAVAAGNATITITFGTTSGTTALVVVGAGTAQANLNTSRYQHNATTLDNGQVLVAGGINCSTAGSCTYLSSAELYVPGSSTFINTGSMSTPRSAPAVLLNSGKIFVAGGYACDSSGNCSSLSSTEIYDPVAGTFSPAGTMSVARSSHTMTVLGDGTVLIAGGENCSSASSCNALHSVEIYDPSTGVFTTGGYYMSAARYGASAVLLNTGSVLIAGGFDGTNLPATAEIYTGGRFTYAGPNLSVPRFNASATLLNNGQVLISGGSTCSLPGCPVNAAEIYDPVANTFSTVANGMVVPRFNHTATLLTNGTVLIAGGYSSCNSSCTGEASTEVYDPVAGTFSSVQSVATALAGHTGTLQANGNLLLIGGINAGVTLESDEWYQPTSFTPAGLASITVTPATMFLTPGQTQQLVATGTFNDGSTQTLQSVIWNSANPSVATITAALGSTQATASVNVQNAASAPIVTTVSPTTGATGVQVTISGSGFGTTQGSGNVWRLASLSPPQAAIP